MLAGLVIERWVVVSGGVALTILPLGRKTACCGRLVSLLFCGIILLERNNRIFREEEKSGEEVWQTSFERVDRNI